MTSRPATPPPAPPRAPSKVADHELHLLTELIRKLHPEDGSVFVVPADTDPEKARTFAEALSDLLKINCFVVIGDIQQANESDMNAAGWYRK